MYQTVEYVGLLWQVKPLDPDEQIEVECIFLRAFGPAAGAMIAALVEGLAPALIEAMRETTGEGESFDLAKIASLDTADPRVQDAWHKLLDSLTDTASETVRDGLGVFAANAKHTDFTRLFWLVLLSDKVLVQAKAEGSKPHAVKDFKTLGELLQRDFRAKWGLLFKALGVTYGRKAEIEEAASE